MLRLMSCPVETFDVLCRVWRGPSRHPSRAKLVDCRPAPSLRVFSRLFCWPRALKTRVPTRAHRTQKKVKHHGRDAKDL